MENEKKNFVQSLKKIFIGEKRIKFFIFLKKLGKRIIFGIGMILLIANLMWLYYGAIGKLLIKLHDLTHEKQEITDEAKALIASNFQIELDEDLFTMNCDLGEEGAVGRFMLEWNKMCVTPEATTYVLNHELVHYALGNMNIYKKLEAKELIKQQIKAIKKVGDKLNEDDLSFDDWTYYKILTDHVNMFAGDESYTFYDWVELLVFTHRGNEEYISYAVGPIVDFIDGKLVFIEYDLENELLKDINNRYKQIYSLILDLN